MAELTLPTARDWMSTDVMTFSPDDDLFEAMEQLLKHHFAAAPVVDEDGTVLGVLTEKDCLRVLTNLTYDNLVEGGKVREYQSAIRAICEPGMDLFRVVDLFLATNFPLLPVVEDDRLCGVVSRRDMLRGIRAFRKELDRVQAQLEKEAGHQADRPRTIESMQRTVANQTREQLVRLFTRR
jgi:CBS domain-containing protein